jgi:hypothetical protein
MDTIFTFFKETFLCIFGITMVNTPVVFPFEAEIFLFITGNVA